jgi:hypothetical protein
MAYLTKEYFNIFYLNNNNKLIKGAIYYYADSSDDSMLLTINYCTFTNNLALKWGGAILNRGKS